MPSSLATECTFQVNVMFLALIYRRFLRWGPSYMHCCCVPIRNLALARLSCFISDMTTQYIGIGLLLCFMHTCMLRN